MRKSPFFEVPESRIIAENELTFALFDKFPISPGHTLIVTKREIETWWDTTEQERIAILDLLNVVKAFLDTHFYPNGYNVGFNAGKSAGQTVAHFHLHVIPRFTGDSEDPRGGIRQIFPTKARYWDSDE
mgnify:CR=1 FL=1